MKLTWRPGTGEGAPVDHYDIMRSTTIVGHADGDATSFVDDSALPKQEYDYQVIAVSADGARLGATTSAKTSGAPAGTATLTGVFNVKVHPTSHSGFSSFTEKDFTAGWRFVPSCKQPPCDTQLRDLGSKDFLIHLKRTEGTYEGSVSVSGRVSCNGHDSTSSVTVTIHATLADTVREDWRITKFTGTMSEYTSPQLGCTSASVQLQRDRFAGEGITPARLQRMEPSGKLHASRKASSFTESVIREMTRLANQHDAINLGQGFPDFPAPAVVKEAAAKAIAEDHNQYPITWGVPAFRRAIATTYARDYGMTVDPETEICVTCGATEAMAATFLGVLDPGDEVVVFEPFYESYGPDSILAGATLRYVTLRAPDWSFDPDELAAGVLVAHPRDRDRFSRTTRPGRSSPARSSGRSRRCVSSTTRSRSPTRSTSTSPTTASSTYPSRRCPVCASGPSRSARCPRPMR